MVSWLALWILNAVIAVQIRDLADIGPVEADMTWSAIIPHLPGF